jgi:hypothetical protein
MPRPSPSRSTHSPAPREFASALGGASPRALPVRHPDEILLDRRRSQLAALEASCARQDRERTGRPTRSR